MNKFWEIAIVIVAICGIIFVAASSYTVFMESQSLVSTDDFNSLNSNLSSNNSISNSSDYTNYGSNLVNGTKGDYKVDIYSEGNWTFKFNIDGKSSEKTGNGNSTVDLNEVNKYSNITLVTKANDYSSMELYSSNDTFLQSVANSGNSTSLKLNLKIV